MSKEIDNAYRRFLQYERERSNMQKQMSKSSAPSARGGLLAPKSMAGSSTGSKSKGASASQQPIDLVVEYVQRIRKHRNT